VKDRGDVGGIYERPERSRKCGLECSVRVYGVLMGIAHCPESLKTINGHICVFRPGGNSTENRKTEKLKNRKTEKPKNRKTEKPKNLLFLNS
jgi:hypothetical protein